MGHGIPGKVFLGRLRKQTEKTRRSKLLSNLFSSRFLPSLPSMMEYDLETQKILIPSSSSYLCSWVMVFYHSNREQRKTLIYNVDA